ncbi:MAG: DMT family transporter [Sulfolobales archaeon]
MSSSMLKGLVALILTSVLWGTSFPVIKTVMYYVNEYTYTWVRSLIAILGLTPYLLYTYYRGRFSVSTAKGGLLAGIAYALGLWLQGWGTKYTTASNSAFITGLSVIYVHIYSATVMRRYSIKLFLALILSISGLYLLTTPTTGFNLGDLLVLAGSFMWALQIILVDRYSSGDPLIFTLFEMVPALTFLIPDVVFYGTISVSINVLLMITYLAFVCSNAAFALQVFGQRYVSPAVTAIVFLLEPVVAATLSYILLGEVFTSIKVLGASLILTAMFLSSTDKYLSIKK